MKMLQVQWTICIVLLSELIVVTMACPNDTCAVIDCNKTSIATQPGRYNSTDGTRTNFYYFSNITLRARLYGKVIIQCPFFTPSDALDHNGLGFISSTGISIIGLTFTKCGKKTFGSYFEDTNNLNVVNSVFRGNQNNGLGIRSGTNVSIVNCTFEENVGLQKDSVEFLIQYKSNVYGGSSLGINLRGTNGANITVKNCTFKNNVALKSLLHHKDDSRPYNYIPYGTGGGIYINLNSVTNVTIRIANCTFYNNTALHQGGGIVAFMTASRDTRMEVVGCHFIENKAIGYPLFKLVTENNLSNYSELIKEINSNYSIQAFNVSIRKALLNVSSQKKLETAGGIGGALIVNFFRDCEHNKIVIKNSTFQKNLALAIAGVGIFMRDAMFGLQSGINSNRAWIYNCSFNDNHALVGGSAIGFSSRTSIDIATLPTVIEDCQFEENIIEDKSDSILFRFGINGVISTIRLPLTFRGVNQFKSNIGGCINIINAKADINGTVLFTNNGGAYLGGAMRIVGFSFVQLFPITNMTFTENSAQRFGGAIGVDNVRVEEDLQSILNYNCFLQYDVGGEDEIYPSKWKVKLFFDDNMALQGHTMYAEDISRCTSTPCHPNKSNGSIYEHSFFSFLNIFKHSQSNVTRDFVTASSVLKVNDKTLVVFPGEKLTLSLKILDQNNNKTEGIYRYFSNKISLQADVINIDLTAGDEETSFGFVNGSLDQRAVIIVRNSEKNFSFSALNHSSIVAEKDFFLNLTDSSTGITIKQVKVIVKLRPCHFLYNYNNISGKCQFNRDHGRHILRGDNISTYFYIKSEWYGELEDGMLRTARIPPFYQSCYHDEGLAGCLIKYNDSDQQCSQGRKGFLCGQCPHGSESEIQGLAFNLLECVSCETADRILFILICIAIVVLSILIMYYNIGLPNSLRGFLFYSQMIGYVYVGGARSGALDWDFFLSRVFGFSFYFPICLARMEALQVVLFGYLPPLLILMSVIIYTIMARWITPLSNKKTLDGIWFLILIVYVYTFDTCLNLLRCTPSYVHSNDFRKTELHSLVYFYDGSVTCFKDEHIIYAVISILILLTFIIPFPFVVVAISHNYFKRVGPFTDVINNGIKPKFKWWSGYDLLRRLTFVAIFFAFDLINSGDYTQFALTLCAIFILLITSRIHPYNKWTVNLIECLILLDLVFIAAYFVNTDRSVTGSGFAAFLFVLPYIYMLIYVVTKWIRKMDIFKDFRKRRINVFAISTQSLLLLKENDAMEENEDSPYIQYREELLQLDNSL